MKRATLLVRLTAGLGLMIGLLALSVAGAGAQAGATITIHNRICPGGFDPNSGGDAFFSECHGTPPDPALGFAITGGATLETDAEGNVVFDGLAAGTYEISGGVPGEFAETVVYCSDADDVSVAWPFEFTGIGIAITVAEGDNVVCDWYNIPIDLSGNPTPSPTKPTTTLPNTGAGVGSNESDLGQLPAVLALAVGAGAAYLGLRRRFAA
jgi:hypothetical protein